jgi:dUTP pyrophosphatase
MSRYFEYVNRIKKPEDPKLDGYFIPERKTKFSAGYDFVSPKEVIINPNSMTKIETGIKAKMENDEVLMIYVRSSLGIKKNLALANGTGIVDADYYGNVDNDGEIIVNIWNYGNTVQKIDKGDRFAQGVFVKYLTCDNDISEDKAVRLGGTSSTGK